MERVVVEPVCHKNDNNAIDRKLDEQTRNLNMKLFKKLPIIFYILAIAWLLLIAVIFFFWMNNTKISKKFQLILLNLFIAVSLLIHAILAWTHTKMATDEKCEEFAPTTATAQSNNENATNEIKELKKSIELMKVELAKKDEQLAKLKRSNISGLTPNRNQLLFNGQVKRSRINWTIRDFDKLVTKNEFKIFSPSIKLFGFEWTLSAETDVTEKNKEWLGVYLCATAPSNYNGPYSIMVNCSIRLTNKQRQNDMENTLEIEFKNGDFDCWGYPQFAKFENLLDQNNGFITADGKIYIELDFLIKSITIEHMQIAGFK